MQLSAFDLDLQNQPDKTAMDAALRRWWPLQLKQASSIDYSCPFRLTNRRSFSTPIFRASDVMTASRLLRQRDRSRLGGSEVSWIWIFLCWSDCPLIDFWWGRSEVNCHALEMMIGSLSKSRVRCRHSRFGSAPLELLIKGAHATDEIMVRMPCLRRGGEGRRDSACAPSNWTYRLPRGNKQRRYWRVRWEGAESFIPTIALRPRVFLGFEDFFAFSRHLLGFAIPSSDTVVILPCEHSNWIRFTLEAIWIISMFKFRPEINWSSTNWSIAGWICILQSGTVILIDWKLEWEICYLSWFCNWS